MSRTNNLPEEVVIEILSWLPVKSLMRFRCISKTWCEWISFDLRLIKLHFDRSNKRNPGVIVSSIANSETEFYYVEDCISHDEKAVWFEIPFRTKSYLSDGYCDDFVLVNICNGLVCLTDGYNSEDSNVYVWNPLTRDHIIVPVTPFPPQFCREWADGYPDPGIDIVYGFGFHKGSNEYKVLRLVSVEFIHSTREFESDVSVYTLGTKSWRSLGDIMDYNISLENPDTALVNGALHWFTSKCRPEYIRDVLVSFDLQDEVFREIPQPQYTRTDSGDTTNADEEDVVHFGYSVRELGGLLCILQGVSHQKIQIWIMRQYGVVDSWLKHFDVDMSEIPLGVANNEEIILIKDQSQLILYNSKTISIKNLYDFGFQVHDRNFYIGSLLSPTMINKSRQSSV